MSVKLNPCPHCGSAPDRFDVGSGLARTDVITCPKGCMERFMRHPVHIRSVDVRDGGFADLGDAWNTGKLIHGDDGRPNVQFDRYAPGHYVDSRLLDSFRFYQRREMDADEKRAASQLKPISAPLGLTEWRLTNGNVYAKGSNAVLVQAGINQRAQAQKES